MAMNYFQRDRSCESFLEGLKERKMDESRYRTIVALAENAHAKRERFRMLGLANTPHDPEERRKSAVAYEVARAEMIEAEAMLRLATGESVGQDAGSVPQAK